MHPAPGKALPQRQELGRLSRIPQELRRLPQFPLKAQTASLVISIGYVLPVVLRAWQ
jgi:hypothetical protein